MSLQDDRQGERWVPGLRRGGMAARPKQPSGVRDAAVAEVTAGASAVRVARKYGISVGTVRRWADRVSRFDGETIRAVRQGMGVAADLVTFRGQMMALEAEDPIEYARWNFGAKLAQETKRAMREGPERPQSQMLAWIQSLHVQVGKVADGGSTAGVAVDGAAIPDVERVDDAPGRSLPDGLPSGGGEPLALGAGDHLAGGGDGAADPDGGTAGPPVADVSD